MSKILIVEDEETIADLEKDYLELSGFEVEVANDGETGLEKALKDEYSLFILDLMLPGVDGFELMEYISPLEIPVIFITAKNSVVDRVRGLKMGADDYIVKPFEIVELLARVEAVLRRNHKIDSFIEIGDLQIDLRSRVVKKAGQEIILTKKEFDILVLFVQNPGAALYRETIYERVWGGDYTGNSRTVDLHVQRLRKKTGWEDHIKAVHKVGYRLEV